MFPRLRLSDNKMLYRAKVEDTDFQLWDKNRTIDKNRVKELIEMYQKDNYHFIPGLISVFKKGNQYYVYDGQHRYESAKIYSETNFKNISMDVSVLESTEPEIILQEFQNVNKSIPIPDFLLNAEVNEDKRKICEQVVEWLAKTYSEFCMKTKKPRKPNFRKDDLLDTLYDNIPNNVTVQVIKEQILEMNIQAKEQYSKKAIKKSIKYDFYLFYEPKFAEKLRERLNEKSLSIDLFNNHKLTFNSILKQLA